MADEVNGSESEMMHELVHILGYCVLVVSSLRPIGITKATKVGREHGVMGCQSGHNLAPGV